MSRYYSRSTDKNQKVIVADLRKVPGMKVKIISRAGRPAGDLLVKYGGRLLEVEIKRPGEHLNANQVEELEKWGDDCYLVAETTEQILEWFGLLV